MSVRQIRSGQEIEVPGKLPTILAIKGDSFITTTIFAKYNYRDQDGRHNLESIVVAALPSGMLQEIYNPSARDSIWLVGRDAPSLGEDFRVRLSFARLKQKADWRVQKIPMPPASFIWAD